MSPFPSTPPTSDLTFPLGNALLWDAIAEANRVHRGHRSHLGGWYIPHPIHLALIHLQFGFSVDDADDLSILLADTQHDTVEDCPEETSFERIGTLYGSEVERLVRAVTHVTYGYDKRAERETLLTLDWKVQALKLADIAANSIRIAHAVRHQGLATIQGFLNQSVAERCTMEREFVRRALNEGESGPERAQNVRLFARDTVDALEASITEAA